MSTTLGARDVADAPPPATDIEDFFENGAIGLHLVDRHGTILRANKAELDLLGYSADSYIGRSIADFHADPAVINDILSRLSGGERLDKYPARLKASDGSIKHVLISSSVLFRDGEFINSRCFTVDVTAAKEAEAARQSAERRLLSTYESVTVGIADTDTTGAFIRVNSALEAITGYSRNELLGMRFEDLTHPDDRSEDISLYRDQIAGRRESYSVQKRYLRKDDEIIFVEVLSSTARSADGAFEHGVRVVKDVTEQRKAERRLQESERLSRELLSALPVAVYTTDRNGTITYFNQAAVDLAGRRPQVGHDVWCVTWKLYQPDGTPLPHADCPMAAALKTGKELRGIEAVAERPDGRRLTFVPYPTLLRDSDGEVIGAINVLVDITERKDAEDAQKLLVDELNHRVKNTLATVQSLAMHTQKSTPESFGERFEARLIALSKTHDLLTQRLWTGVGLRDMLNQEFAPYVDQSASAVALLGEDLTLSARDGLALGMVIHELATNAAKYGALSCAEGRVDLNWLIEPQAESRRLTLRWSESGGPTVIEPSRRGFGRRLIERNVIKDLRGTAEMRFEPTGLQCELTFPYDAAPGSRAYS